jgi:uncharacterized membrane protein YjgN (DUF898 family)
MSNGSYELVFHGEILDGFDRERVKAEFGRLFNLTAERLDQVFSHPHVVLRKGLDSAQASHYQSALTRLGLKTLMRPAMADAEAAALVAAEGEGGVAVPVEDARAEAQADARRLPFEFTGRGGEFFKIWIVNIFLTILTLGIYSAWAKVRTQGYFYGNTRLDGASFEYLAKPLTILKGRLIAFACLVAYTLSELVHPFLPLILGLAFVALLPWIVARSLAFNANNSAWRNVRFGFTGTTWGAAKAILFWPLAGMLSFGLLVPFAMHRQAAYIVGNARYGTAAFGFDAKVGAFYRLFLVALAMAVAGFLAAAAIGALLPPIAPVLAVAVYVVMFTWFNVARVNLVYGNTRVAEHRLESGYEFWSYLRLGMGNLLGLVLTLGLFYPWARVRSARYGAEHLHLLADGSLDDFSASQAREVSALGQEMGDVFDVGLGL